MIVLADARKKRELISKLGKGNAFKADPTTYKKKETSAAKKAASPKVDPKKRLAGLEKQANKLGLGTMYLSDTPYESPGGRATTVSQIMEASIKDARAEVERSKPKMAPEYKEQKSRERELKAGLLKQDLGYSGDANYEAPGGRSVNQLDIMNDGIENAKEWQANEVGNYKFAKQKVKAAGVNSDNFLGQANANLTLGRLAQDENKAWNDYISKPTDQNRLYAQRVSQLKEQFIENNNIALDDKGAVLPWLSKSAAGYLPQLKDQLTAGATGALAGGAAGAAVGSVVPGLGTAVGGAWGAKSGYVVSQGLYSYGQMRGAAYKTMLDLGVPDDVALKASQDEALLASLIEMGDAAFDLVTLGAGKLLGTGAKLGGKVTTTSALKAIAKTVGKYGVNVLGEGAEEKAQEAISIANESRIGSSTTGLLDLGGKAASTYWNDGILGKNKENQDRMRQAQISGMKIAAMIGGAGIVSNSIATNVINRINNGSMTNPILDTKKPGTEPGHGVNVESSRNDVEIVKAGEATVIKSPYKGDVPTQIKQDKTVVRASGEHLQMAQSRIVEAQSVAKQSGKSFRNYLTDIYKTIFENTGGQRGVVVDGMEFGGKSYVVTINKNAVSKVIADTYLSAEKIALLDVIDDVIENGNYVGSGNYVQHGKKTKNTTRFDYFETQAEIGGKPYIVAFDVEVFPGNNNYRTHKVINKIDLVPATSADTVPLSAAHVDQGFGKETTLGLSDTNIPQSGTPVNTYDMQKSGNDAGIEEKFNPLEATKSLVKQSAYMKQISDVMRGDVQEHNQIVIGDTPLTLQQYGAGDKKITLSQSAVRKIAYPAGYMGGKHNLGFKAIEMLPRQLENPVAIFKSDTQKNSLVIVTELIDSYGKPVIVPLHLDKQGHLFVSNEVASMYGRNNFESFVETQREKGNILFEDKNRALQSIPRAGLQLPRLVNDADPIFKHNIPQSGTPVNTYDMQKSGNDAGVEEKHILARLSRGEMVDDGEISSMSLIQNARKRAGEITPTISINTPDRIALRQSIMDKLYSMGSATIDKDGKVQYNGNIEQGRRADIVIGLPAAGKSSVLADPLSSEHRSRIVDSDMAKSEIPEFAGGYGANSVHEESKLIAETWEMEAVNDGDNIVLPIVGSNLEKVIEKIDKLKKAGYSVYLHLNELPNPKAVGRGLQRFIETGRYLDPQLIKGYGNKPTQVYETIREMEGYIDGYSRYSNDVPFGQRPILKEDVDFRGKGTETNGLPKQRTTILPTEGGAGGRRVQRGYGDTVGDSQEAPTPQRKGADFGATGSAVGGDTSRGAEVENGGYGELIDKYGAIPKGETPERDISVPRSTTGEDKVRQFVRTALESKNIPDDMVDGIQQEIVKGTFSYTPISDIKANAAAKKAMETYGFDGALQKWDAAINGTQGISDTSIKETIALGERLITQAQEIGDTKLALRIIAEVAAQGTRYGQGVQAMRLLKRMSPIGRLYYSQKVVDNLNADTRKKKAHVKIDENLAGELLNAKTKDEINAAEGAIFTDVASQMPPTLADKWNAWRYLSMLGNPRTHIKNVVGNAVFSLPIKAKNIIATGIEKAAVKAKLMPQNITTKAVLTKKDKELLRFAKDDYAQVENVLAGTGKMNPGDIIRDKQQVFKSPILEKARVWNSKALEAEDRWFLKHHYSRAFASEAKAKGLTVEFLSSGTPRGNAALQQLQNNAIEEAQKATFRDASAMATALNRFSRSGGAARSVLIEGVLPFKKTPINILKRGVEYSPIGLVKGLTYDLVRVKNKEITPAKAIDNIAAGLTGTAILGLGAWLAASGILTDGGDEDEKQAAFDKLQGGQNYALQFGNSSYTIDWAAPTSLPLFVGAELYNVFQKKGASFADTLNILGQIAEPLVEMSMLQGIEKTISSVRYGDSPILDIGTEIPLNYFSQAVPTVFGQIARTIDPTRRTTYVDKNNKLFPPIIQKAGQKALAKLPFGSQALMPYTDQWGREQDNGNIATRAIQNFVSPGYFSKNKSTRVDEELQRLYDKLGDGSLLPSYADKSIKFDDETINFTGTQYLIFSQSEGQRSYEYINNFMGSDYYDELSDEQRTKVIKKMYGYATAYAKTQVSKYEFNAEYGKVNKLEQAGVKPYDYYAFKEISDIDSHKKAKDALEKSPFSRKERQAIFSVRWPDTANPFE